jgi:hypothetical protein
MQWTYVLAVSVAKEGALAMERSRSDGRDRKKKKKP